MALNCFRYKFVDSLSRLLTYDLEHVDLWPRTYCLASQRHPAGTFSSYSEDQPLHLSKQHKRQTLPFTYCSTVHSQKTIKKQTKEIRRKPKDK